MSIARWTDSMYAKLQVLLGERAPEANWAVRRNEIEALRKELATTQNRAVLTWTHTPQVLITAEVFTGVYTAITQSPFSLTLAPYDGTAPDFRNPAVVTISGQVRSVAPVEGSANLILQASRAGENDWQNGLGETVASDSANWGAFTVQFTDHPGIFAINPGAPLDFRLTGAWASFMGEIPVELRQMTIRIEQAIIE